MIKPIKRGYSRSNNVIEMVRYQSPVEKVTSATKYGLKVYAIFGLLTFIAMVLLY